MILLALQDEIRTLIEKQQTLMARLRDDGTIWRYEPKANALTQGELERQIAALASDKVKVEALESTIAVIGTMKAGKSTTINALIGEDVLPHRLTAMTTLPTLIRHKPGQKEPVLKLHKLDVFKKLVNEVKSKVDAFDGQETDQSKINEALTTVKNRSADIRQEYVGKDEIHQALFLINDTLRLAGHDSFAVELDAYLQQFTELTSLPTVEVEFRCLAGNPQSAHPGSLALLDTPGPNEAGQSDVLKRILSEQIEKNASMVLLVMNYTQLNTEQDSEIRNQIKSIKEVFKDRSFVVVNRFDEKKQNDLDETQTKKLASDLLNDSIDDDDFITPDAVFPVSSHYAFIVEKVRQQIEAGVELSSFLSDKQNRDFIKAAFGMIEEDEIEELTFEDVEKKCARLLKRSGYAPFINNMLEKAYTKAGENSLQAALARLNENAGKIDSFSTVVRGGLAQEMHALMESIERTKNLGHAIDAVHRKLEEVKGSGISEYRDKARTALAEHVEYIKSSIGEEFVKARTALLGKLEDDLQEKSIQKADQERQAFVSRAARRELRVIESDLKNLHAEIDKHSKNGDGVLDFGADKQAALIFSKKAGDVITALFSSVVESLQEQLSLLEGKVQQKIQAELVERLGELCRDYETAMQEKGFDFDVRLTDSLALDVLSDAQVNVNAGDAIETYQESVTRVWKKQTRREGWVHKTLKVLSFGLRDDYTVELQSSTVDEARFKIVLDDYVQKAKNLADSFYANVDARLAKQFEERLVPAVDEVFAGVIDKVNGIEGALEQSKKLKAESVVVTSAISATMDGVKSENVSQLKRLAVAKLGIEFLAAGK
ncbi:dynamin family protein [Pseudomonas oryzihabitans]|uniref:dynamin family protein n=1 Tax=Pseudomonas oryzihabitans TaxID=47885 RepID=UPI0025524BBE|nr:dynamin family protein [Pseudomonas oryzihabitans]MDK8265027.1 dynamin family protein [Pseudomonas oryzihabitans]